MAYIVKTVMRLGGKTIVSYYARGDSGAGAGFSLEQAHKRGKFKTLAGAERVAQRLRDQHYNKVEVLGVE